MKKDWMTAKYEPGRETWIRRDTSWRRRMRAKGITLRSDIDPTIKGRTDWWNWDPPSDAVIEVLRKRNKGISA